MTAQVAVTGIGLLTPAGLGVDATWDGLSSGSSFATTDPLLAGLPVDISCALPGFTATEHIGQRLVRRTDPFIHMAVAAAQQAVTDAALEPGAADPSRIGVVLGVGGNSLLTYGAQHSRMAAGKFAHVSPLVISRSVPSMAAGEIATYFDCRGPNFTLSSACASGGNAIGVARDLIRSGTCDIVLAGGAESGRSMLSAVAFARTGALSTRLHDPAGASRPFDRDRDGFVLGEGAAVLVLERAEHARARRAACTAMLVGYGAAADAHHPTDPHPDGRGLRQAITAALADARLDPADIDHVSAHGTATPLGDPVEARVLRHVFASTPPPTTALKSVIGHALGAAAAIQAACAVLSLRHQAIPPTANLDNPDPEIDLDIVTKAPRSAALRTVLSNASGFGGANTALIFQTP